MRELTISTFLTIDGVMQSPGAPEEDPSGGFDKGGWLVPHFDDDLGRIVDDWFARAEGFVLGRATYEAMRGYWPQVGDDEPVARALNGLPKHVATSTPGALSWAHATPLRGDVVAAVRELKSQPGGELQIHGSWQLAQALIAADLIDRFQLLTCPVVLGAGKRLFPDGVPVGLRLLSSSTTGAGVVAAIYERAGEVVTGAIVSEG